MRARRALLLFACVGCLASARPMSAGADRVPIEELTREASSLAPEFAADLMIRIAGAPANAEIGQKQTLLEGAFMRAYGAQEPYKRAAPPPLTPIDSRVGGQTRAF